MAAHLHRAENSPKGYPKYHTDATRYAGDLLGLYAKPLPLDAVSGRNHSETWAGCIVSLTTPTTSLLRACRSVSSLSLTERASKDFCDLYAPVEVAVYEGMGRCSKYS